MGWLIVDSHHADTSSGASSGHRSESSDTSNSGEFKHIKEEALTHTAHLLGMDLLTTVTTSSKDHIKGDSGNESDGNHKAQQLASSNGGFSPEPDFNKIITDLKTGEHDLNNVTPSLDKSSDAIFKDLINSLPI
jgi:hypothetical protein